MPTAFELAQRGYTKASTGDYRRAIEDYNEAIRLNPNFSESFRLRADAKESLGDYRGAIEDCNEAIRLNPKDAHAFRLRGYVKGNLGDYQGELEDCSEAIRLNPNYSDAFRYRGYAKVNLGDYRGAIEDYNEAIRLNPNYSDAFELRGFAKLNLVDYRGAIEDYNEAIRLNSNDADAFRLRGHAKGNLGDYLRAIEDYNEAIRLNPNVSDAFRLRGDAKGNLGDYRGAIEDYSEAIRLNPHVSDAFRLRGDTKESLSDYRGAIEDCSEAIRLNPKDADAFKLRGHAKGSLGDYRGELEDCSEAIRLNPNEVDAFRLRGHAKENLGNYQEALEDLETFVRMGGNRSVVAELIAKLEQITTTESSSTVVNPVTSSDERKPSAQSTLTIDEEFKKAERYYKKQEYKRAERHYKIAAKHGYPNAKEKLKEVESLLNKLKIQASSSAASSATAVTSADQANSYYSISSLNTLSGSASPLGTSTSTKHKSLTNSSASTDAVTVPTAASLGLSSSAIAYASLKRGEKLGSGGFGVVYKGEWQYTTVAIKQLKLESLSNDSQNEFNKEVALMQALRHPHVVTFYGACTEPGKYAIVMEYCALGSLFNWLRTTEAENWSLRLKIAGEIARGLAYLHSQKILHRDLKSLNVLLDEHTKAKITDFGLSKVKTETASTTTAAASTGTLMWMAPELFSIKGKHSEKSDMYAYGITLWEIAARKLPYEEARGNSEVIRTSVKEGEREDIPESTPPSMVKLIAKCWAQRAEERPTAAEAILMLEEKETPADATAAAVMSYRGNLVSHK